MMNLKLRQIQTVPNSIHDSNSLQTVFREPKTHSCNSHTFQLRTAAAKNLFFSSIDTGRSNHRSRCKNWFKHQLEHGKSVVAGRRGIGVTLGVTLGAEKSLPTIPPIRECPIHMKGLCSNFIGTHTPHLLLPAAYYSQCSYHRCRCCILLLFAFRKDFSLEYHATFQFTLYVCNIVIEIIEIVVKN